MRYARWKAPAEDSQSLIWPEPSQLLLDAKQNSRLLSSAPSVLLQNVPLPEVRRSMRQWLGYAEDGQPLIATGHQAELHHPGVWVKLVLIDALAQKLGGRAVYFAVDTDEPKHLVLRWPDQSIPLTDDPGLPRKAWSGLLNCPTPSHLESISAKLEDATKSWSFRPAAWAFLEMLKNNAACPNLPAALTQSLHDLDASLGLRYESFLMSRMCLSEPFLVFAHHVLAHAEAFAADYNRALEEYRNAAKIRAPGRPMPNLRIDPQSVEVPFWLDDLSAGTRTRASVTGQMEGFILRLPNGDSFRFRPNADGWVASKALLQWLNHNNVRLAPRALTITAFLRLLVADHFVHGIGGAQYDQVLDGLIERHLGLEAPKFCVTTATLYFPESVHQPRACLSCVMDEGHHLRHAVLGEEKQRWLAAIMAEPRHTPARSQLFYQMHGRIDAVAESHPQIKAWQERLAAAQRQAQQEKVLFDRELFYAIQPPRRLEAMIDHYRQAVARPAIKRST